MDKLPHSDATLSAPTTELTSSSRTGRVIVVFVAILALLVVVSKTYTLWNAHEAALARAERDTANAASVLAEHAARTFEGVSRALHATRDLHTEVAYIGLGNPTAIHETLKAIQGTSPVLHGIGWTDAAGDRVASSVFRDLPPLNIADQSQFTVHRERRDAGIHIGAPLRSRLDGTWIIPVSRRLEDASGRFDGVAYAVLRIDYFLDFYRAFNLGPDTAVLLYRDDGVLLTRQPMKVDWMGKAIGAAMATRALASSGPVVAHRQSRIDGFARIAADQAIRGFPLAITASMSQDDALARYREFRLTSLGEGALMILALVAGGILLIITIRRRVAAVRALADTGALLTSVFAATDQAISVYDSDLRAVAWNDLCADIFPEAMKLGRGAALEDMLRASGSIGEYRVADVEAFVARCMEIARSRQPARYERVRPDGTIVDVGWLPLPNGYLAITHTDVTRIKRAEVALRESEARAAQAHARLANAIESLTQPFMLWDAQERLVLFNRAAADMLTYDGQPEGGVLQPGITYEEMVRRHMAGTQQPSAGREESSVSERLEQFRRGTGERFEIQHANGRWHALRDRRTEEGGIVSTRVDITETKHREAELSKARHAADAANRAKSDFLSRMSHELRTPLNAVIGFSQLLQFDPRESLSERQRGYCKDIESGGRHLLGLVNDVLDLTRIETGNERLSIQRVAAAKALASLRTAMGPIAEAARIDLTVEAPVGVADVRVDDMRLHQVLLNLVSNAIKYNRKNGSVRVTAEDRQDGRVRFLVTDTGLGISAEHRTQLFEPFHRLGQERSGIDGTGIGLSICKRLTEAMGGSIGLDSTPGEGSTFWVEFAADAAPAWQPAAIDRSDMVPKAPASRFSLLYVEDNPSNMRLMQELVAVLPGVAMLSAETPEKGLELARAHRPDVILLDLNLPGMSGYEVLAHLQAMPETSAIPAIAVTAAAMPEDVERGYAAGFTRYLTKPIDAKEFLAAICDCIPFDEADETPIEVAAAD